MCVKSADVVSRYACVCVCVCVGLCVRERGRQSSAPRAAGLGLEQWKPRKVTGLGGSRAGQGARGLPGRKEKARGRGWKLSARRWGSGAFVLFKVRLVVVWHLLAFGAGSRSFKE